MNPVATFIVMMETITIIIIKRIIKMTHNVKYVTDEINNALLP